MAQPSQRIAVLREFRQSDHFTSAHLRACRQLAVPELQHAALSDTFDGMPAITQLQVKAAAVHRHSLRNVERMCDGSISMPAQIADSLAHKGTEGGSRKRSLAHALEASGWTIELSGKSKVYVSPSGQRFRTLKQASAAHAESHSQHEGEEQADEW